MTKVIREDKQVIDNAYYLIKQELSDGTRREISKDGEEVIAIKIIQPDGSYVNLNGDNNKTSELTSTGYWREYDPQTSKLKKEISPQKVVTQFYDSGNIESIRDELNDIYTSYYENQNLAIYEDKKKNYEIYKDIKGNVNYELKDGKIAINPDWFSYYRLGVKSQNNDKHWDEKCTLNPQKKTLLCLGGDQTKDARAANGNANGFAAILGLPQDEVGNMQLVSCYRPFTEMLRGIWYRIDGYGKQLEKDYEREILQKFMPFMARKVNGKLEKLSAEELKENFGNIMIQAHCYGANDLPDFDKVFKDTMTKLGYPEKLQKEALKQIICITNNSQREMTDDLSFTCIHRYSVKDGQFDPVYNKSMSAEYPVFVQDYQAFADNKGNKAAFIATKPNEMIMVYDKILTDKSKSDEHNSAFWTTKEEYLTPIGRCQARLMAKIGEFWYHNHGEVPNVEMFMQKITENDTLHPFVAKALAFGKKLKIEKKNMLVNHHILKSVWNKFNHPKKKAPKNGVYKLLSDKYKE